MDSNKRSRVFHHPKCQIITTICGFGLFVIGIPGLIDDTEVWTNLLGKPTGADGMTIAHWLFLSLAFVLVVPVNVLPPVLAIWSRKQPGLLELIESLIHAAEDVRNRFPKGDDSEANRWRIRAFEQLRIAKSPLWMDFCPCDVLSGDEYMRWAVNLLQDERVKLRARIDMRGGINSGN